VWGQQTDSKPASVLANKPSIEGEKGKQALKGIIASAFADLAKKENRENPVLRKPIAQPE